MKIKSIRTIGQIKGKKVLLRADFNVPVTHGKVDKTEDYRIVQTLPTIKFLIKKGAKVIILAHLGRPDGKIVEEYRLDPVVKRLSDLLKKKVLKSPEIVGHKTNELIASMKNGEVLVLENVRFDKREEAGDRGFARELANLGDKYVNDAFSADHRDHASISVIQHYLSSYAGLLLEAEIKKLLQVLKNPKKPLTVIIGGSKISTKIKLIKNFLKVADHVLLGGALANTVLKVMGVAVGKSLVEPEMFSIVKKFNLTDNKLRVPVDCVTGKSFEAQTGHLSSIGNVKDDEVILDIGPDTLKLYASVLKGSKMVVWNGPMGKIETAYFSRGTKDLIKILSAIRTEKIVGGGETVQAIRQMKMENKFNFISTGGGAMLEFLEGKKLPGLKKLIIK